MARVESYSLRQVVELTGLSEFTLRGWETRYGAFSPRRTETGRRQYTAADLRRALLLRELTKRNHRIGAVAHLPLKKLDGLLEAEPPPPTSSSPGPSARGRFGKEVERTLKFASLQEWDAMEDFLAAHSSRFDPLALISDFLLPLLRKLSEEVARGRVTIAQEHVVSAMVKAQLYRIRDRAKKPLGKIRLLIAAPEGDYHDLGILTAHALAANLRVRSLYLGPNTPKNELSETALRYGATHLILGSTISRAEGAREDLYSLLHYLDRHLPQDLALWVGGRHGSEFRGELARPFSVLQSLPELEQSLRGLRD